MDSTIHGLEEYFETNHKIKIFLTRLTVKDKSFHVIYDYDKKEEIEKFVSNFTEYLPYYVYPADVLENLDVDGDLSKELLVLSKSCWSGPSVPTRDTKVNGIFGEVFLDFYERIVNKAKLASTYVSRRDFNSNYENKGFDNVLFLINNGEIEIVFAESKFVANKSSARDSLVKDIKGDSDSDDTKDSGGHLTKKFLNDYVTFIVEKNSFFSDDDKKLLKPFLSELNTLLAQGKTDFVSFLIQKNIKINCVFFAIFKNTNTDPNYYCDCYDAIEKEAKDHLDNIGFINYNVEIVFIPTKSESMKIKGEIDGYYKSN
ncbi:MAG: DUF1837 domain-containing protein [Ruminococcus flavefaciens]|nr:DUF1837 domain-containing protein [Ruminococcus flavefaciens]